MQAYLRVHGDESMIRAIHEEAALPHASIKQLKAKRGAGHDHWWDWQTERVSLNIDDPDGDLKSFLIAHRSIFPTIKKYRDSEVEVYLEIVTKYEESEEPRGLYLSAKTIALLGELGGALDNDVEAYGLALRKI
jgi:hypothetical protein